MVDLKESAEREREANRCKHIRHNEAVLAEVCAWEVFFNTSRYDGKQIPVLTRPETFDHLKMLITDRLVRLKQKA